MYKDNWNLCIMNLNLNLKRGEGNSDFTYVLQCCTFQFGWIFLPWAWSADIPATECGLFTKYAKYITHSSSFTRTYIHLPSLICTHLQLHAPSFIYTHLPSRTRAYLHSYHMHSPSLICTSTYIPVNEKDGWFSYVREALDRGSN